jgi:dephospho-CoA kinase
MDISQSKKSPFIIFLTGALGVGKTTLLHALENELSSFSIIYLHFDSIGVPSKEDMIKTYGSGSEWQKAMTKRWVEKLTREFNAEQLIIFEGQGNLDFIISAFQQANFNRYKIILVHCDKAIRHKRLQEGRNQPELINDTMDNWANFLYDQTKNIDATILDSTLMTTDGMITWFKEYVHNMPEFL